MPALLTRISQRPNCASTACASACDLRGLADVAAHRHGAAAGGLHQADGRITVLRIGHDHLGAVVRQPPRIRLADARGRSGDDGDLADMAACHPAPPCHSARRARPPEQDLLPRKTGWLNLMMLGHNRKMSGAECLADMLVFQAVSGCLSALHKPEFYGLSVCACLSVFLGVY